MKIPQFSADLIHELDQAYPARPPDPRHTEREIWMRAGERRLVEALLQHLEAQEENPLDVHVLTKDAGTTAAANPSRSTGTPYQGRRGR